MSYCVFLCLRMLVSNIYFVVFFVLFVFILLPVSLNCPFLIAPLVFSYIYFLFSCKIPACQHKMK